MLDTIVSTLRSAAKSDKYCTKITTKHDDLALTIEKFGVVKFPVSAGTAKSLIKMAKPARFGRREKTLYDPKVRDVWEIPKNHIKIAKRDWSRTLDPVLEQVQRNLGLSEGGKLTAELHNMLIYEPGQFFTGHQDSEKTDGMVATLVVLLPSEFSGGALVVDQQGDKQAFRPVRDTAEQLTFIAFYADCHHEVKKVTKGYRIALTYNLIFEAPPQALPLKSSETNEQLIKELKAYFSVGNGGKVRSYESKHPLWFVYLLDHQYTQRSLSWQSLKGADRLRASELLNAAEKLGLTAHLALADIHETWSAEGDVSWDQYGGYGGYEYDDDETDEDEDESSDSNSDSDSDKYELTELIDDSYELRHWIDGSGKSVRMKEHSVPGGMICWTKAVDEFKPFNSEYEGYMGNYGNTLDRWYHRAAIVLWKKESKYANLFAADANAALRKISQLLKKDLAAGQAAIEQVLPQWPEHSFRSSLEASVIFDIAIDAQRAEIASRLIKPLGLDALSQTSLKGFLKLIETYGEPWCLKQLQLWASQQSHYNSDDIKDLLPLIEGFNRRYQMISSWLLEHQFSAVVKDDKNDESKASRLEIKQDQKSRMTTITSLLKAAWRADEPEIHRKVVAHSLAHPRVYPAIELAKLLRKLDLKWKGNAPENWGHGELVAQLKTRLENELSAERKANDWSIAEKIPCRCADCKVLGKFLLSANERSLTWPLAKDRRGHIHRAIGGMDIPVTHVTHRTGSPQKLMLTKTPALFQDDKVRLQAISDELKYLRSLS